MSVDVTPWSVAPVAVPPWQTPLSGPKSPAVDVDDDEEDDDDEDEDVEDDVDDVAARLQPAASRLVTATAASIRAVSRNGFSFSLKITRLQVPGDAAVDADDRAGREAGRGAGQVHHYGRRL